MKSLYESILDDEEDLLAGANSKILKAQKNRVTNWLKENADKSNGRWKIDPKTFKVSIECNMIDIVSEIPDYIEFGTVKVERLRLYKLGKNPHLSFEHLGFNFLSVSTCDNIDFVEDLIDINESKLSTITLYNMKHIDKLPNLSKCELLNLELNSVGVKNLVGMPKKLDTLMIRYCPDFINFKGMTSVNTLEVMANNTFSWDGLTEIQNLKMDSSIARPFDTFKGFMHGKKSTRLSFRHNHKWFDINNNFDIKPDKSFADSFYAMIDMLSLYKEDCQKYIKNKFKKVKDLTPGNIYIVTDDFSGFFGEGLNDCSTFDDFHQFIMVDYKSEDDITTAAAWSDSRNINVTAHRKRSKEVLVEAVEAGIFTELYTVDRKFYDDMVDFFEHFGIIR